ncbi:MAG: LutB/LldF family L-lactate oxidation iron-sulfur protein [candidate division KSB1 bacterium]|nr:LutB/LldF family L-lactate oxidation iron-sulfur protein [candidate division KSB1 bacterium]
MSRVILDSRYFYQNVRVSLDDSALQNALRKACDEVLGKRAALVASTPHWEELRRAAHRIKEHTLARLDYYLLQLEKNLEAQGVRVHWAENAEEACTEILTIARKHNVWTAVKSKSMTSEEVGLNAFLEGRKIRPVETDLGEYIQQLSGEPPFHIVTPAMHRTRQDVGRIFAEKLGVDYTEDPEALTQIARRTLRRDFLSAEMGITGANFAVADPGLIGVVENEGNARLSTTAPRVHVVLMGIEKVIPTLEDLRVFLNLLSISSTAQRLPCYVNLIRSPRQEGDRDGPEEVHVVLLDNGRSRILADPAMRSSLYCIRCGACLNVCPVFQRVGGHAYGWVYQGPIGSVLTPLYRGLEYGYQLPFGSSLCGACAEICPVAIDVNHLLVELRARIQSGLNTSGLLERLAFRVWSFVASRPRLYRAGALLVRVAQSLALPRRRHLRLPVWSRTRTFPKLARRSFYRRWRQLADQLSP